MSTSKFYRIDSEVSEYWAGWYFESGSFFDPEGNAYRPEDLRATWYGRQFWQSEAGTTAEICLLKSVLRQRIEELSAALIVEVRRHDLAGGRLIGRMEISRGGPPHDLHSGSFTADFGAFETAESGDTEKADRCLSTDHLGNEVVAYANGDVRDRSGVRSQAAGGEKPRLPGDASSRCDLNSKFGRPVRSGNERSEFPPGRAAGFFGEAFHCCVPISLTIRGREPRLVQGSYDSRLASLARLPAERVGFAMMWPDTLHQPAFAPVSPIRAYEVVWRIG